MTIKHLTHALVGLAVLLRNPPARDERGLSQSSENAILLAGAVGIAITVIGAITVYVNARLPR